MKKVLFLIAKLIIFGIGVGLVVVNQRVVGYQQVGLMLLGLGLLLGLIYDYNRNHQV